MQGPIRKFLPHITIGDLRQLAGWLEGEGCFRWVKPSRKPRKRKADYRGGGVGDVSVLGNSTDQDVIKSWAEILETKCKGPYTPTCKGKDYYYFQVSGTKALNLLLQVFPFMKSRRRAKISEVLGQWEHSGVPQIYE